MCMEFYVFSQGRSEKLFSLIMLIKMVGEKDADF